MKYIHLCALGLLAITLTVGCKSSAPSDSDSNAASPAASCTEPENPYDETMNEGHYRGYEWAQENNYGTCGGNSESFIEGCEEYEQQETDYENCEARKK